MSLWMYIITHAVTALAGAVAAMCWASAKGFSRPYPLPINVVRGVVLPEPDDPRWDPITTNPCTTFHPHALRIGAVTVHFACNVGPTQVLIGDVRLDPTSS